MKCLDFLDTNIKQSVYEGDKYFCLKSPFKGAFNGINDLSPLLPAPCLTCKKVISAFVKYGRAYCDLTDKTKYARYKEITVMEVTKVLYGHLGDFVDDLLDFIKSCEGLLTSLVSNANFRDMVGLLLESAYKALYVACSMMTCIQVYPLLYLNPLCMQLCVLELELRVASIIVKALVDFGPNASQLYSDICLIEGGVKQVKAALRLVLNTEQIAELYNQYSK